MKTKAQESNITKFPYIESDESGNVTYFESETGFWYKREYNSQGDEIYFENSLGFWIKQEFDSQGNKTYYEDSEGDWFKMEFDSQGERIYHEDSNNGLVINNRPTVDLIIKNINELSGEEKFKVFAELAKQFENHIYGFYKDGDYDSSQNNACYGSFKSRFNTLFN